MKHFALILLAALTWSVNAQITYPYNPDGNGDQYIAMYDLQDFLSAYGQEWIPGEIQVDSIPLSAYLEAMEALILANAMPAGTNPGQFLRWNGDGWELVMPKVGCTLPEACNYDETAHVLLESMCVLPDACGVCGGPGAVYDCGCADIPEGECDCDGNVVDALGVCGGTCEADEDGDGICDDGDSCVGQADECGVCNGPGAIYDCGCTEPVEGTCDCDGNVEDVLGVCGGSCTADEDFDGICDDEDDCVGEYDGCGVCNGPGPVLGCGCNDIPEGFCDCNGNVLDAVGTCGGACQNDLNGDGICDDGSIPGCTYEVACNYDPSASINDGSCDFTSCYGCTDIAACNYDPAATIDNGICWYAEASYDCDYNCLIDTDGDGVCDDLEVLGCTDEGACNFEAGATEDDGTCEACSCADNETLGCTDADACNFSEDANCDDGSCTYPGCNNPLASNYDESAGCDDGSCIVYGCTVDLACNYEPTANVDDNSCEFGTCPGCNSPNDPNYNPTSTNADACAYVNYSDSIFSFVQTVPTLEFGFSGQIEDLVFPDDWQVIGISVAGAKGGGPGGKGAVVNAIVDLDVAGRVFQMLVGGRGGECNGASGGGGGSFLVKNQSPFIIAGGGSGGSYGVTGNPGLASWCAGAGDGCDLPSRCDGNGGEAAAECGNGAGGGGGFYSDGDSDSSWGQQRGFSFLNGGSGGSSSNGGAVGGFGGGAGTHCSNTGGGAGGGYSGGNAPYHGGGFCGGGGSSFTFGSEVISWNWVTGAHDSSGSIAVWLIE